MAALIAQAVACASVAPAQAASGPSLQASSQLRTDYVEEFAPLGEKSPTGALKDELISAEAQRLATEGSVDTAAPLPATGTAATAMRGEPLGPAARAQWLAQLEDSAVSNLDKAAIVQRLAQTRDPVLVSTFVRHLHHESVFVKGAVISGLGAVGGREAVRVLVRELQSRRVRGGPRQEPSAIYVRVVGDALDQALSALPAQELQAALAEIVRRPVPALWLPRISGRKRLVHALTLFYNNDVSGISFAGRLTAKAWIAEQLEGGLPVPEIRFQLVADVLPMLRVSDAIHERIELGGEASSSLERSVLRAIGTGDYPLALRTLGNALRAAAEPEPVVAEEAEERRERVLEAVTYLAIARGPAARAVLQDAARDPAIQASPEVQTAMSQALARVAELADGTVATAVSIRGAAEQVRGTLAEVTQGLARLTGLTQGKAWRRHWEALDRELGRIVSRGHARAKDLEVLHAHLGALSEETFQPGSAAWEATWRPVYQELVRLVGGAKGAEAIGVLEALAREYTASVLAGAIPLMNRLADEFEGMVAAAGLQIGVPSVAAPRDYRRWSRETLNVQDNLVGRVMEASEKATEYALSDVEGRALERLVREFAARYARLATHPVTVDLARLALAADRVGRTDPWSEAFGRHVQEMRAQLSLLVDVEEIVGGSSTAATASSGSWALSPAAREAAAALVQDLAGLNQALHGHDVDLRTPRWRALQRAVAQTLVVIQREGLVTQAQVEQVHRHLAELLQLIFAPSRGELLRMRREVFARMEALVGYPVLRAAGFRGNVALRDFAHDYLASVAGEALGAAYAARGSHHRFVLEAASLWPLESLELPLPDWDQHRARWGATEDLVGDVLGVGEFLRERPDLLPERHAGRGPDLLALIAAFGDAYPTLAVRPLSADLVHLVLATERAQQAAVEQRWTDVSAVLPEMAARLDRLVGGAGGGGTVASAHAGADRGPPARGEPEGGSAALRRHLLQGHALPPAERDRRIETLARQADAETLAALSRLLGEAEVELRNDAVRVLAMVGAPALPAVEQALTSVDLVVRGHGLKVLLDMGRVAAPLAPAIRRLAMQDTDLQVRARAVEAYAHLGLSARAVVELLVEVLMRSSAVDEWELRLVALAMLEPYRAEVEPDERAVVERVAQTDPDARVRMAASGVLETWRHPPRAAGPEQTVATAQGPPGPGDEGPAGEASQEPLVPGPGRSLWEVFYTLEQGVFGERRVRAVRELAARAAQDEELLREVARFVGYDRETFRSLAGMTLLVVGDKAVPHLMTLLEDQDPVYRGHAVTILGGLRQAAAPAVPKVLELATSDPNWEVRQRALEAIPGLGVEPETASRVLAAGVHDRDRDVRGTALSLAQQLGGQATAELRQAVATLARSEMDTALQGWIRKAMAAWGEAPDTAQGSSEAPSGTVATASGTGAASPRERETLPLPQMAEEAVLAGDPYRGALQGAVGPGAPLVLNLDLRALVDPRRGPRGMELAAVLETLTAPIAEGGAGPAGRRYYVAVTSYEPGVAVDEALIGAGVAPGRVDRLLDARDLAAANAGVSPTRAADQLTAAEGLLAQGFGLGRDRIVHVVSDLTLAGEPRELDALREVVRLVVVETPARDTTDAVVSYWQAVAVAAALGDEGVRGALDRVLQRQAPGHTPVPPGPGLLRVPPLHDRRLFLAVRELQGA